MSAVGKSAAAAAILLAAACGLPDRPDPGWEALEPGLEIGRLHLCGDPADAPPSLVVVRADPRHFEFRIAMASASDDRQSRTARAWAELHGLAVATNAGMFHPDRIRHVGLLIDGDHVNNGVAVRSYRSVLAFRPRDPDDAPFVLADLDETSIEALRERFEVVAQNLRMVDAERRNVWEPSDRSWSTAALATDGEGRILFVFDRAARTVHELVSCLLELDALDVRRAQYLEGGADAVLYVTSGERRLEFLGSGSPASTEAAGGGIALPIPNVLGLARRAVAGGG